MMTKRPFMHGSQYDSNELNLLMLKSLGCNTEYCASVVPYKFSGYTLS